MSASGPTTEVYSSKTDIAVLMSVIGGKAEVAGAGINEGLSLKPGQRWRYADFCFPTKADLTPSIVEARS